MKKRIIAPFSMLMACTLMLTGCNNSDVAEIKATAPVGISVINSSTISLSEEEMSNAVYKFVTGNMTIDTDDLVAPTELEASMIQAKMTQVLRALRGEDNHSISDDMLNYMLWEFTRTGYTWKLRQDTGGEDMIKIVGIDPATRKIFVDAYFETTSERKEDIGASTIIIGDPMAENLKELRYKEYMSYLQQRYSIQNSNDVNYWGNGSSTASEDGKAEKQRKLGELKQKFEGKWGSIDEVLEEQQEYSLIERQRQVVYKDEESKAKFFESSDIGKRTYTGCAKQLILNKPATMRFRFILDFNYGLGASVTGDDENIVSASSVVTTSVYLMDYSLLDWTSEVAAYPLDESIALNVPVVNPYIDRVINSYQKCIEESDYQGLFKLFGYDEVVALGTVLDGGGNEATEKYEQDLQSLYSKSLAVAARFKDWDKYYYDLNRYCYVSYGDYDYSVVGWEGTTIYVRVTRDKKIRGRGTDMTMPTYKEDSLLVMTIDDKDVYINSEIILNTSNVGEPLSMIRNTTGISAHLANSDQSFTKENEAGVIDALKKFSKFQIDYINNPSTPDTCIDKGVTQGNKDEILKRIQGRTKKIENEETGEFSWSEKGYPSVSEHITWLGTWASKSNVYCRVRVREYLVCADGDRDIEAYIGLMRRDGAWYVVSYEPLKTLYSKQNRPVSDKSCLSHDYVGKESTSDYGVATGEQTSGSGTTAPAQGTGTTSQTDNTGSTGTPSVTESTTPSTQATEPTSSGDTTSSQPTESQPADSTTSADSTESQPAESQSVEGQPTESQPAEGGQPTESQPTESQPTESQPAEGGQPADVGGQPADVGGGSPTDLPSDTGTTSDTTSTPADSPIGGGIGGGIGIG